MSDEREFSLVPRSFEGVEIVEIDYHGKLVFIAQQMGLALGYANAKHLADNLTQKWSEEFLDGDVIKLTNGALAAFKAAMKSWFPDRDLVDPRASSLILLTESGAQLAAILSRTAQGRAFRRWLVDVVLPERRKGRAVETAVQAEPPKATRKSVRAAVTPRAAEVLRRRVNALRSAGRLSEEAAVALDQEILRLEDHPVRALLPLKSAADMINEDVERVLGPEPTDPFERIAWRTTFDVLVNRALLSTPDGAGVNPREALRRRRNAVDAWLFWHVRRGGPPLALHAQLVAIEEAAVAMACGPMPGAR